MLRDLRLSIDEERCQACRRCVAAKVCKVCAIVSLDPGEPPYIDASRCYDCRLFLAACPYGAIVVNGNRVAGSRLSGEER